MRVVGKSISSILRRRGLKNVFWRRGLDEKRVVKFGRRVQGF